MVYLNGTRSAQKQRTFYVEDLHQKFEIGRLDSREWTTYYHWYGNNLDEVTIQYWRFYAYNDALNDHGGDWESLHVVLDQSLQAKEVSYYAHGDVDRRHPSRVEWEGTHPRVYSEGGGHGSRVSGREIDARGCDHYPSLPCVIDLRNPQTFVCQETWIRGKVDWPDGNVTPNGRLLNVGEKSSPMNGQVFIRYSGKAYPSDPGFSRCCVQR